MLPYISAVIYVLSTKYIKTFPKPINHPEINCKMSIPPNHYFSNNIPLQFSKQWQKLFVVGRVLSWEVLEGLSFVN
jgi:hypothetical protein